MKEKLMYVAAFMLCWNAAGFFVGALATVDYRNDHDWVDGRYVSTAKSGCVYKSISAFTNPGFIIACELFRKRFEIERIEQVVK